MMDDKEKKLQDKLRFAGEKIPSMKRRTISNHRYMRLHIDKWKENGVSTRDIVLMEFLRKNI